MAEKFYIECGKIINTHGCHGGIKLESYCNSPEDLCGLERIFVRSGDVYREYKVNRSAVIGKFVMLELDGINDMDIAAAMKNTLVYAAREDFDLDENEYFVSDLIGLDVIDADTGKLYGKITDWQEGVASDLYVVETEQGERLLPAIPQFISHIDYEKAVYVTPIDGLLN